MRRKNLVVYDILRIVAFLFVLIYHFFPGSLPGGFIGVDLLATLSGFLMTGLFIDQVWRSETGSLLQFWRRRFDRIVPGLLLSVLLILPFTFFFSSDFRVGLMRQAAAAVGFVMNQYQVLTGGSYEAQFVRPVFIHTWTLALEIHFYLFWGVILWGMHRLLQKLHPRFAAPEMAKRLRMWVVLLAGVLWVWSLLTMVGQAMGETPISTLYFSDATRLFPFFGGALAAGLVGLVEPAPLKQFLHEKMPRPYVLLLVAIFCSMLLMALLGRYTDRALYLWVLPVLSVMSILFMMGLRLWQDDAGFSAAPGVNRLAQQTYGLYLFHWPVFVLLDSVLAHGWAVFLSLCISVLLTWLTHGVLEPLLADRRSVAMDQKRLLPLAAGGLILFGIAADWTAPNMMSSERAFWTQSLEQSFSQVLTVSEKGRDVAQIDRKEKEKRDAIVQGGTTIIGDSVTLGVREILLESLENTTVDAKVNRFLHDAPALLEKYLKQGELKPTVIITLGTNIYPNYREIVDKILALIPEGGRLIMMTPYEEEAAEDIVEYGKYLKEKAKSVPYLTIADWYGISQAHPEIFKGTDGTHFMGNKEGEKFFLQMLQTAIQQATDKPPKQAEAKGQE